tara:strand:- start:491 stop:1288 length:798 start_codon:yes stop_codon:yes gene_type:complete
MLGLGNSLSRSSYIGEFNTYSLEFDSTDDYLDCGTLNTQFRDVGAFTISMWIYQEDLTDSGQNGLWGKHQNDSHRTYSFINNTGKVYFGIANGSDSSENGHGKLQAADQLSADTWYHLAFVYDGTATGNANRLKIYVDGTNKTLDFSQTIPSTTSNESTYGSNSLDIGRNETNSNNIFDGKIDEVGIWNVALDADAVTALYNSGKPFAIDSDKGNYDNASDLQVWYRMGDGTEGASGSTIYDMSSNSNDATMTNFDGSDFKASVP